jgi:hypothetical protein
LTDSVHDLLSLGLSCSQWYSHINYYLDRSFKNFLPTSYSHHSKRERNIYCDTLFKVNKHVSSIQVYEVPINEESTSMFYAINAVPWDTNVLLCCCQSRFLIVDLKKNQQLVDIVIGNSSNGPRISFNHQRTFNNVVTLIINHLLSFRQRSRSLVFCG